MGTPPGDIRRGRRAAASGRAASASLKIRGPNTGDGAAVAWLLGELGYPASPEQAAKRLERLTRDPASQLWIAEVDGEVAGFAALHVMNLVEHGEPGCVMSALVVGERFRRRGVGERLADAVEKEARSRGCTRVVLSSAHRRADAHAFYERLGYEHTGRRYAKDL